ncbi:CARDB domain-containing protein [Acidovorax sp. SUPP2539]|uniref:CARDB domain-containing protein n=1 Tax=Acidovorax sp. SUPP2539 TaxID=2920878 RepID=UPI0023DE548B|nr:CARDB domain-containing protein [Acidovorax sp. SUPP2539]GKS88322.1 hypothetical protein AVTE2539_03175 [Acidovorax sp. SUPP2539]
MKSSSKYVFLCASLTLACAASAQALPDLVVPSVDSPNLDGGVITVQVKNQGAGPSAACYLALRVVPPGGSLKVFSPKIPALQPGQQVALSVQTGFLLSQAEYEAIADRSNTVQETNEANNRNKGQFGGKP